MYYGIAENLLGDSRDYIFNTVRPSLGDIHSIWSFDWGINTAVYAAQENVAEDVINKQAFPKVFAWVKRFRNAYQEAIHRNGEAETLSNEDAVQRILASHYFVKEGDVDKTDPLQLHKDQIVRVSPVDFGFTHTDEGRLVSMSSKEVVIENTIPGNHGSLRLHYPRSNFRIAPASDASNGLANEKLQ